MGNPNGSGYFNIATFRSKLIGDGARQNLYEVNLTFPGYALSAPGAGSASSYLTFMCKAASLPPEEVGVVNVPYFGRTIKVPGNRTFPEWSLTVINDESFNIRSAFEAWSGAINTHVDNVRLTAAVQGPGGYAVNATINQWSKDGQSILEAYTMVNAWPSAVAPQDMAWDANDQVEEFQVTMQYDYWINNASQSQE